MTLFTQANEANATEPGADLSTWVVRRWDERRGLPQNSPLDIVQTPDGYIWVATLEGLVRFDGTRFVVFDRRTNPELLSHRLQDLEMDPEAYLWVATENRGVYRFDGRVFEAIPVSEDPGTLWYPPIVLDSDRHGQLWVGTPHGLFMLKTGASALELVLPSVCIWALWEDPTGTIWIGSGSGLMRLEGEQIRRVPLPEPFDEAPVRAFAQAKGDALWVGSNVGLVHLVPSAPERSAEVPAFARMTVSRLARDHSGRIWVGAESIGLFRLDHGRVEPVSTTLGLRGDVILGLLEDREGSLWIGIDGEGLVQARASPFQVLSTAPGSPGDFVLSVLEDGRGHMWIGTYGSGLKRFDESSGEFLGQVEGFKDQFIWSILEDRSGAIWVGTYWGIKVIEQGRVVSPPEHRRLDRGFVRALVEDSKGDLWAGTEDGLIHLSQRGRFEYREQLPSPVVLALLEDRDGTLWVGTRSGLCRLRDGAVEIETSPGLDAAPVRALYQDDDGVIWIGTEGFGLFLWREGRIGRVSHKQGLYDDLISQILEDDLGYLWMSCNKGLFRVLRTELVAAATGELDRVSCKVFDTSDGMPSRECNGGSQPAGCRSSSGRLWFPTVKGAVGIDPSRLRRNGLPPPVHIEQVWVDGRVWPHGTALDLPAGRHSLRFDYTALSFVAPGKVEFRYQLEGFDRAWTEAGTRRNAFYTNLPPGRYSFRVHAANNDGIWNREGAALELRQLPRFYQRRVVQAMAVAVLALAGIAAFRVRLRRLERRAEHLEAVVAERTAHLADEKRKTEAQAERLAELDELKSRFFANISHEFRTPLTLILAQVERVLEGDYGEVGDDLQRHMTSAQASAKRLLRLINQLLHLARVEAGRMELRTRYTDMWQLLELQVQAFLSLAERRGIRLKLVREAGPLGLWIDREKVEQALSNLMSNALKFTGNGGVIRLKAWRETGSDDCGQVRIDVSDTGCGIPPEFQKRLFDRFYRAVGSSGDPGGTGIGLALARELVVLHGGELSVESEVGKGSTFSVCLPVVPDDPSRILPGERAEPSRCVEVSPGTMLEVAVLGEIEDTEDEESTFVEEQCGTDERPLVLIVDDHPGVRDHVAHCLGDEFRVAMARDGKVALARAERLGPDLVISDVMMPEMDGFQLCRAFREREELSHIPMILLTARTELEDKLVGLAHGADDYLPKPFNRHELKARVTNLIEARKRLHERYRRQGAGLIRDISATPLDEAFLSRAVEVVNERLADNDFSSTVMASELAMSPRNLQRKLNALLGEGPRAFIQNQRLDRAAALLDGRAGNVSEISYEVGFADPSTFSKAFSRRFGKAPSELLKGQSG